MSMIVGTAIAALARLIPLLPERFGRMRALMRVLRNFDKDRPCL
jgi:hypothetical protein